MSILCRTVVISLLLCALAPGAYCASESTVNKNAVALRETVIALTGESDINSTIDLLAAVQLRVVGASNDSTWKGDNPNWATVFDIVHDDLSRDLSLLLLAQVRDIAVRWDYELPAHLTSRQITELVNFYCSEIGQRYLRFQKRLAAVQVEGTLAFVRGLAARSSDSRGAPEAPPTAVQITTRKSIASLFWGHLIMPAMDPSKGLSQGTRAGDAKVVNDMRADALATMYGSELDQLGTQYSDDLRAFAIFQESTAAKALILTYGFVARDLQADPAAPGKALAAALQRSIEQHSPEWRAAYQAGRLSAR